MSKLQHFSESHATAGKLEQEEQHYFKNGQFVPTEDSD